LFNLLIIFNLVSGGYYADKMDAIDSPAEYTALQGDIRVNYNITSFLPASTRPSISTLKPNVSSTFSRTKFTLSLIEFVGNNAELLVREASLYPETPVGTAVFPCGTVSHAGRYLFKIFRTSPPTKVLPLSKSPKDKSPSPHQASPVLVARSRLMLVTWPDVGFRLPSLVDSYSTGANVTVSLTRTQCAPFDAFKLRSVFRVRALATNRTSVSVDVTSLFKSVEKTVYIPCHAFGHAGMYRAEVGVWYP
jgi:hypothetical protein